MAEVGEWRDLRERNQGRSTKTRLRSHGAFGPKPCGPMRALMHANAQPSHRARSAHIGQSGTQAEYARTLYCMRASSGPTPYSDRRCVHHRRNDGSGEHRARTCRRAGALRHRRASVSAPSERRNPLNRQRSPNSAMVAHFMFVHGKAYRLHAALTL